MDPVQLTALIIFILTYTGIIFTRLPWINIDRPSAAFFGAIAMVLAGVITFQDAVNAVDYHTIALLLGMMIIITTLQLDGFFVFIARKTITLSKSPGGLLTFIVFVTGIGSAFLVNDAVVLMLTPVIITLCRSMSLNPVPYLIAEILSSNTGSTMTITGNPQNMLIGMTSGIPYGTFLMFLLPVSVLGMIAIIIIIKRIYRSDFIKGQKLVMKEDHIEAVNFKSMRISVPVFAAVIVMFFIGHLIHLPISLIALAGASAILIFGKIKPSRIIKEVDWVLLVFFASLFMVVHAVENVGLLSYLSEYSRWSSDLTGIISLHGLSLVASQIVSNVPFTVAIIPLIQPTANDLAWLTLASASTLAGNATIIGAVANLIVIESAGKMGVKITFRTFLKAGLLTTIVSFVISIAVLGFCLWMGLSV
jgi:Na+/H+ antiporter NhaD/arsenite permease-like protein